MSRQAPSLGFAERGHALADCNGRVGPVDEQKVDVVQPEPLEALFDRPLQGPLRNELRPHLGGHENVVAPDPGGANACTDRGLVVIALRGIDMAESELQRFGDDGGALLAAQFPCPAAEDRYERLADSQCPVALVAHPFRPIARPRQHRLRICLRKHRRCTMFAQTVFDGNAGGGCEETRRAAPERKRSAELARRAQQREGSQ